MTFLALCFFIYFAPSVIASSRQHPSATAIWFANFFFAWTGIGWIACFVWTLSVPRPVFFYPAAAYLGPSGVAGRPPGWTPADEAEAPTCTACYRPLLSAANYCTLCGASVRGPA